MFRNELNRLVFSGDTGHDVLPAVAALHTLVHKQGYQDVTLDFSGVGFLAPSFMVPLVTVARAYRSEKVDFDIVLPNDSKTSKMLLNTNWAHLIKPETGTSNIHHLSALQYRNADEHSKAVDLSIDVILRTSEGIDRSRLKALEWAIAEITDNVLNHSESAVGGIVQVVSNPKKSLVEFYVCDAGLGIPKTLRQGRPELSDDVRAVRAAIEEGVTRNSATNQGNGLFGTFKCCEVSG